MFRIRDKVVLGALIGALVTLGLNLVDYLFVVLKIIKWHIWQMSGSLYCRIGELNTLPALAIGAVTHISLMALAGVIICYVLYYTGTDFYPVKGAGVLLIFYISLYGGIISTGIASIKHVDVITNGFHLLAHLAAGLIISFLIVKFADDKVWDRSQSDSTKNVKPHIAYLKPNNTIYQVNTTAEEHKVKKPTLLRRFKGW